MCEVELISWTGEEGRERGDPTEEAGFIINRQSHWFALRKVKDHFWNLDSLLNRPEHISAFYLTALLSQFREDGCSVFLIRGTLLEAGVYRYGDYDAPQWVVWWRESQLLSTNTATNTSQQETLNGHLRVAGLGREEDNDDDELMLAIAMSESLA